MTDRPISKKSLQNLRQFNQESRQLSHESMEIALVTLLEHKTLGQITISELVSKAGVSRNAFYRNYRSKEAILEHLLTSVIRRIFRGLKAFDLKTQAYQAWLYLFNEAKKEAKLLKIIFKHHMQQLLTQIVTKRLKGYQRWKDKNNPTINAFSGVTPSYQFYPIGFQMIWSCLPKRWQLWGFLYCLKPLKSFPNLGRIF